MRSRAAVFWEAGRPLTVHDIELEEPGPGQVLVRMAAVGICGTDLHMVKGEWERPTPMVLGHEGSGVVEAVGEGVEGVAVGDEVVLSWAPSCGECADCKRGRPAACLTLQYAIGGGTLLDGSTGMTLDGETLYRGTATGALSERLVVSEQVALPLGEGVPLEEAALLGCAALTGVGAVLFAAHVEAGSTVLVVGAGGVGQFVVQGARIAGATSHRLRRPQRGAARARAAARRDARRAARRPPRAHAGRLPGRRRLRVRRGRRPGDDEDRRSAGRGTAACASSSACRRRALGSSSIPRSSSGARSG